MNFWHSTATHKPSTSGTFMVYQETTGFTMVADCEHFVDGSFKFVDMHDCTSDYLEGITYFAEIPPIPLAIPQEVIHE